MSRYPERLLERGLKIFNEKIARGLPINGETGVAGLRLDFNCGLRLEVSQGQWRVRITDVHGSCFFDKTIENTRLESLEKYRVDWKIEVWRGSEKVFEHEYDPRGMKVHFVFAQPQLGDNLVLLPYAEQFRRDNECDVSCTISKALECVVKEYYPYLHVSEGVPEEAYATYYLAMWMNLPMATPVDARLCELERFGQMMLGSAKAASSERLTPTRQREIKEKYVCISVQASSTPKCWLNPRGWTEVVERNGKERGSKKGVEGDLRIGQEREGSDLSDLRERKRQARDGNDADTR